jgi:hypothetical protein
MQTEEQTTKVVERLKEALEVIIEQRIRELVTLESLVCTCEEVVSN